MNLNITGNVRLKTLILSFFKKKKKIRVFKCTLRVYILFIRSRLVHVDECFCWFRKPACNSDFSQVMDTFQENLMNNNFELITIELFNDNPKLQIENLKVSIQTQRLSYSCQSHEIHSRHCEFFQVKPILLSTEKRCSYYCRDVSWRPGPESVLRGNKLSIFWVCFFVLGTFPTLPHLLFDSDAVNYGSGRIFMVPLSAKLVSGNASRKNTWTKALRECTGLCSVGLKYNRLQTEHAPKTLWLLRIRL